MSSSAGSPNGNPPRQVWPRETRQPCRPPQAAAAWRPYSSCSRSCWPTPRSSASARSSTTQTFSRSPPTRSWWSFGPTKARSSRSSSCSPCPRLFSLRSRSCSAASPQTSADVSRFGVGIAAAVVQVIGLMRWPLIVPSLADSDDTDAFDTVHTVLGTVVGETFGYLLTAALDGPHHFRPRQASRGPLVLAPRVRSGSTDRRRSSRAARRPGYRLRQLRRIHPVVGLDARLRDSHIAAARAHRESRSNTGLGRDPGARRELLQPGLALRGVRNGVGAERDSASCRAPSTPWRCRRGTRPARPCRRGTPSGARTEPRSCLPCRSRAACP